MTKQRIALGLAVSIIVTIGLYAVLPKQTNVNVGTKEIQPIKVNVVMSDALSQEIIEIPKPKMPQYDIPMNKEWQEYLFDKCKENGISYELALAMIQKESNFDYSVVHRNSNGTYDYGLFQINTINLKWLAEELNLDNFIEPHQNIKAGVYMMKLSLENSDNEHIALMKYNMGSDRTKVLNNRGIFSSEYSRDIVNKKNEIISSTNK